MPILHQALLLLIISGVPAKLGHLESLRVLKMKLLRFSIIADQRKAEVFIPFLLDWKSNINLHLFLDLSLVHMSIQQVFPKLLHVPELRIQCQKKRNKVYSPEERSDKETTIFYGVPPIGLIRDRELLEHRGALPT